MVYVYEQDRPKVEVTEFDDFGAVVRFGDTIVELHRDEALDLMDDLNRYEAELEQKKIDAEQEATANEEELSEWLRAYGLMTDDDPIGTAQAFAAEADAESAVFGDPGALVEALLGGKVQIITL